VGLSQSGALDLILGTNLVVLFSLCTFSGVALEKKKLVLL
jgi:hypothetical protein